MAHLGGHAGTRRGGTSAVSQGAPGLDPWLVEDTMEEMEVQHMTLTANADVPVTFAGGPVRLVHILNWSTTTRLLVKDSAIISNTDAGASRIGIAPANDICNDDWFPYKNPTATIHLRSGSTNEVTVIGYR